MKNDNETDLSTCSTKELIEELSKRCGSMVIAMGDSAEFGAIAVRFTGSLCGAIGLAMHVNQQAKLNMSKGWYRLAPGEDREIPKTEGEKDEE